MQITNSVVCGASKGCIYKQIKPPLVDEHAFPLMGFVCKEAHVTIFLFRAKGKIPISITREILVIPCKKYNNSIQNGNQIYHAVQEL